MQHYRNIFFFLGILLYFLLFSGYIVYSYSEKKDEIIKNVDKELYYAAINLPLLLPEGFHHKAMKPQDYTKKESLQHIKKLSQFVATTRLQYLYALIEKEGKFYFTASSATPKELESGKDLSDYFNCYEEADGRYAKVMQTGHPDYSNLKDHWGEFRTLSMKLIAEDGTPYIIGADINLDFLDDAFNEAWGSLLLFIFPIIILMLIYLFVGVYFHLRLEKIVRNRTREIELYNLTDTLTGLPNRKSLEQDIKQNSHIHLAVMNVDGFQVVNDLYGNLVGDQLIEDMTRALGFFIKDENLKLYKLHADEFAFATTKEMRQFDFLLLIERIIAQLEEKVFSIDGNSMSVVVSVGAASMVDSPLINATIALKEARKLHKKIYLYESHLDVAAEVARNQEVIAQIHDAIKHERIFPYFQPIYSIESASIVKYESLMRMELSDGSIVAPGYFLEISHQAKLYPKLSLIMLEAILERAESHPEMSFSFNLSAIDIEDIVMAEYILRTLKSSPVAKQLTLEILETEGFHSYKTLAMFIAEVKSYGVTVAIDDFGSGYSNFAEIVELNVDYLKIDGSLVKQITTDSHYEHIIMAIIKFAKSLGLQTIAEFVEDEVLANKLIEMGVDMLQGYYIGRPAERCEQQTF